MIEMKVINIDKLKKFDIAAEYHQAWHESQEFDDENIPFRGRIPEEVFRFISFHKKFVVDSIIEECSEEV